MRIEREGSVRGQMAASLYRDYETEDEAQAAVFQWAEYAIAAYPCLKLLHHIPNEGKRSASYGARLKRLGMKRGVSDICLPVARGGYHGLYIELKVAGGKPTSEQKDFLRSVNIEGFLGVLCYGSREAITLIERYVKGEERV